MEILAPGKVRSDHCGAAGPIGQLGPSCHSPQPTLSSPSRACLASRGPCTSRSGADFLPPWPPEDTLPRPPHPGLCQEEGDGRLLPVKSLLEMERSLQARGRGVGDAFHLFPSFFLCSTAVSHLHLAAPRPHQPSPASPASVTNANTCRTEPESPRA